HRAWTAVPGLRQKTAATARWLFCEFPDSVGAAESSRRLPSAFRVEETGRGLLASRFPGAQPLRVQSRRRSAAMAFQHGCASARYCYIFLTKKQIEPLRSTR